MSLEIDPPIIGFNGPTRFLSNFHPCRVEYEGITYRNTEAAFQAAKSLDPAERQKFADLSPGDAKKLGRRINLRPDWENVKVGVMRDVLRAKFAQPDLRKQLLATGTAQLEERNTWGDRIWGTTAPGVGKNLLGKLLMEIRAEISKHP